MEADAPLLAPLIELAGLFLALAFIVVSRRVIEATLGALASWLSFLPGIGSVTSSLVHRFEQAISNALGNAISGIESAIGHSWHSLSRVLGSLWAEQKLVAENLWHIAKQFYGFASTADVNRWVSKLTHKLTALERRVTHTITREIHSVTRVVHSTAQGVYPRLRSLEHEVSKTIPREIKSARALAREAEDGVVRLWKAVRALPTTADIAAAVATAVAAIDLFKLNPFRCSEATNLFNRGCSGVWGGLEDLLGLLLDAVIFVDLCQVIPEVTALFGEFEAPLTALISDAATAVCAQAPAGYGPLPDPTLYLPANPGVVLNLP